MSDEFLLPVEPAQDRKRGKVLAFCALFLMATLHPCAAETIQLGGQHGTYTVPVRINGAVTLPFVLDTGASAVAIPEDVFLTLTRTGTVTTSDFIGTGTVQLADGSEHTSKRFVLHEVQVGNHVVRNVVANVVSVRGDPLLGQSFLSRLPAWSIDNQSHSLVLHDQSGVTEPPATTSLALPPSAQAVLTACKPDIARFCGQVAPGEGRIKACMREHIPELSEPCKEGLFQTWLRQQR